MSDAFFVCDLRPEFAGQPYVTFWRPENANYAWPLEWSGRYRLDELQPGYHEVRRGRTVDRFPVPCEVVEQLAKRSKPGQIDGGVWAVVPNTLRNRRILRAKRFRLSDSVRAGSEARS
jgi:hypothetical protein